MPDIDTIARQRDPLAAVRRAAAQAARDEAWFQIAVIESVDLAHETPAARALARQWLVELRDVAQRREAAIPR
jgi:hypothetical protein